MKTFKKSSLSHCQSLRPKLVGKPLCLAGTFIMKTIASILLVILMTSCVLDRANVQPFTAYNYAPVVEDSLFRRITDGTPFPKTIDSMYYSGHYYSFRMRNMAQWTGVYYRRAYYRNHRTECLNRVELMHKRK